MDNRPFPDLRHVLRYNDDARVQVFAEWVSRRRSLWRGGVDRSAAAAFKARGRCGAELTPRTPPIAPPPLSPGALPHAPLPSTRPHLARSRRSTSPEALTGAGRPATTPSSTT